MQKILGAMLTVTALAVSHASAQLYWDVNGSAAGLGGTGTWDTNTANWNDSSGTGTAVTWTNGAFEAVFQGPNNLVTLGGGLFANRLNFAAGNNSLLGSGYLTLLGNAPRITVAAGVTATNTNALAGADGFIKDGGGVLVLGNLTNRLSGGLVVSNGGVILTNVASALRHNSLDLGANTYLLTAGGNLRLGGLSGAGGITNVGASAEIHLQLLSNVTFSGIIVAGGGLNVRGPGKQTFTGNATGLGGTIAANSGAEVVFASQANATSGVIGSAANIVTRGGTVTFDATGGEPVGGYGHAQGTVTMYGGTLQYVGNATAGDGESVGALGFDRGASVIRVVYQGAAGSAQLRFGNGTKQALRDSTGMTVDFQGAGATLGGTGGNPQIVFTGSALFTGTGGLLANTAGGTTVGWATVDRTNWATHTTNSIKAATETIRTSATLGSVAAAEITRFTPTTPTTTLGAGISPAVLKISPDTGGQTLAIGANNITTTAIMLTGTNDFTITGTGKGLNVGATHYIYVTETNGLLNYGAHAGLPDGALDKSGPGTLFLNASSNQVGATANANLNLLDGVLRFTSTSIGGASSSGGAFTTMRMHGATLELSGGGTFTRALDLSGAAGGGGINFDNGSSERGDPGFSAIGGDANYSFVTAVGGSTLANLVWDNGAWLASGYSLQFGSVNSDSRATVLNPIGLDNGTAGSYFARQVFVRDNPNSANDVGRLAGPLTGSANSDLLKTGPGVLELSGTNTYAGATLIREGTLRAVANFTFSTNSKAVIMGGTLDLGAFTNTMNEIVLESGSITGAAGGVLTGSVYHVQSGAISGTLAGAADFHKTTINTVTLDTNTTFTGRVNISSGTLQANVTSALGQVGDIVLDSDPALLGTLLLGGGAGVTDRVRDTAPVRLNGGAIRTGGFSETLGVLTLSANSTVDLGAGVSLLNFADSSGAPWSNGAVLTISNWSGAANGGGTDRLTFGGSASALTDTQLGQIQFSNPDGFAAGTYGAAILSGGEVVPVPEPATVAAPLALLGWLGWHARHRLATVKALLFKLTANPGWVRSVVLAGLGLMLLITALC